MPASREDSVYMAKLAEQAERYEDMVSSMKEVSFKLQLSVFEYINRLTYISS